MKGKTLAPLAAIACACAITFSGGLHGNAAASQSPQTAGIKLIHPGWLTVGSDTTYPPMEFRNSSQKFAGADVDLAYALAHAMGLKGAIIVDNSFDSIIPAMTTRHAFDVIMSSMNNTPERRRVIGFVNYMQASEGILVKSSSATHANSYTGMCGRTVAVETGTTEQDGLNQANKTCSSKINIKTFTKDTDAYQAFASGHADAYTGDLPVVALYVKQSHGALRMAGKAFGAGEDYGIGLPKNAFKLRHALVTALHKIQANGQYRSILRRWGVGGAAI